MRIKRLALRKKLTLSALIAGCFATAPQIQAADYSWNQTGTQSWATGANWTDSLAATGTVPTAADNAIFNLTGVDGTSLVTLNGTTGITNLSFVNTGSTTIRSDSATSRTLTVSGLTTVATGAAGTVEIGGGGAPVVLAGAGGINITSGTLTLNTGNTFTGNIAVDGANSVLAIPGAAYTTTSPLGTKAYNAADAYKTVTLTNGAIFRVTTGTFNVNVPTATNIGAGQVYMIGTGGATFDVASGAGLTIDDGTAGVTTTASNAQQLQGSGAITKTGAGTLTLRNQFDFLGTIDINEGTLVTSGTGGAFGSIAAGTTIHSGAVLNLNGFAIAEAEPLTISGTGISNNNVIRNSSTTGSSFSGPITLAANSTVGSGAGGGMTLSGGIGGSFDLTVNNTSTGGTTLSGAQNIVGAISNAGAGTGGLTISGVIANSVTNVTQAGAGTLTISTNVYNLLPTRNALTSTGTGGFTVSGGIEGAENLTLNANSTGAMTISTGGVNNGGTITNQGTGTGTVTISGPVGTNVTGIIQNSPTSMISFTNAANPFVGPITIKSGVLDVTVGASLGTNTITLGDSAAADASFRIRGSTAYNNPVILGVSTGALRILSGNGTTALAFSGGITGTNNVILDNGTNTGTLTFNGTAINNAGTVSSAGTSTGGVVISTPLGPNVTGVFLTGSNNFTISGAFDLTSIRKSLNSTGSGTFVVSGAITGTENLAINANSTGNFTISTGGVNNVGTITNQGTGAGATTISGVIGTNVTGVIQNSLTSNLTLSGTNLFAAPITIKAGTLTITGTNDPLGPDTNAVVLGDVLENKAATFSNNVGGTTANPFVLTAGVTQPLTISSPNTGTLATMTGGVTGTNDLFIGGTNAQGIAFATGAINNAGKLTNVGTGTGPATISAPIGPNVTNVVQNSASSQLRLTGTNLYTGTTNIQNGVLVFVTTDTLPSYPTHQPISVASGGTLGLGYGAASGQFTDADILAASSGGFATTFAATGAALGLDTTTAVGGLATYTGTFANPTGVVLGLNKLGAGTLVMSGTTSYTGTTTVSGGALKVTTLSPGNLTIAATTSTAATYIPTGAAFERNLGSGAGEVQLPGGASGFTSQNAGQVVAFGTIASPSALTWGDAAFNPSAFVLNDTMATGSLELKNDINLGTAVRTVTVNSTNADTAVTISGDLTSGAGGGLTKAGAGTLVLTGANSYAGATAVTGGRLTLAGAGTLAVGSAVTLSAGTTIDILDDTSGTINYGNAINVLGTAGITFNVGNNVGATTGSKMVFGAFSAPTTSTNTATTTTFNSEDGYSLQFASLALPGTTGQTTTWNANVDVVVTGNVTNRMSGFGATNFDTLVFNTATAGSAINGVISDASGGNLTAGGTTRLTKGGVGTLTLTGANTYTGVTTVSAGTLKLVGSSGVDPAIQVIGNSNVININASSTLAVFGNVNIASGTATAATGQGNVIVAGGTTAATRGTVTLVDNAINTLTIRGNNFGTPSAQSLTLGGTGAGAYSVLNLETNNTTTDKIALNTGNSNILNLQLGGAQVNLTALAGTSLAVGTHNLLTADGGIIATGAFTLGTFTAPGKLYSLNTTANNLQLIVSPGAGAANAFFTGAVSSNWSASGTTNFETTYAGGTNSLQPSSDTSVFLTGSAATNFTSTVDASFSVNSLNFTGTGTPAAANSITLDGTGLLTLTGSVGYTDQNAVSVPTGTGIVVQAGSTAHTISAPLYLAGTQSWQNDSTNALTVSSAITGTGGLTKTGTGTIVLTGAGTYTGNTAISAGTLQLGNGGTTGTLPGTGTFVNNGNLSINRSNAVLQGTDLPAAAITGTGSLTQAGAGTTTLAADNTYQGGTSVTAGILRIGNAAAAGNFGSGAINVASGAVLAFNRTDTLTLGAGNVITSAGTVRLDRGTVAVSADGQLNTTGALLFGASLNAATNANLDLTLGSAAFSSLTSQTNFAATPNAITIGAGKTLDINGNFIVRTTTDGGTAALNVSGGGTLNVTGTNFHLGVGSGATDNSTKAYVSFAGLSTFNAAVTDFVIQRTADNAGADNATLTLATDNTITATNLIIGGSSGGSQQNTLFLGSNTNVLKTNLLHLGSGSRDSGRLVFAGATGTASLRNAAGTGRANVTLGPTGSQSTGYVTASLIDLNGHSADFAINTLIMAQGAKTANNTNEFRFDTGTLDIKTVNMAIAKGTGSSINTLTIGGGTVRLGGSSAFSDTGTGAVTLATAGEGNLNINGGSVTSSVNIVHAATGAGAANLTLDGGSLDMTGKNIGATGLGVVNLSLRSGTLSNVNEINVGAALSKTTSGTLTYTGTNAYTGVTSVAEGKLLVNGSLTNSAVFVSGSATIGGSGTIGQLTTLASTGIVAPGNSAGNLTFGAGADLSAGGVYNWELGALSTDGTTPGQFFDMITVSGGNLALGGSSALTLDFGLVGVNGPNSANAFWTTNQTWKIVDVTGGTNTGDTNLSTITNATYSSGTFSTTVGTGGDAGDIFLVFTSNVVGGTSVWQGANNDPWTAAGSWNGSVPNSAAAEAKFVSTGGTTAILDANQTVNKLTFDSTNPHTITGSNTLTLAGTAPTISTAMTNNSTQTVAVNLDLAANTAISVQGGTLELNSPNNANLGAGVTATVATGATLSLGGAGNALSNGTSTHANVNNSGTLLATSAGKRVGDIDGVTGTTTVTAAGATLTANHIRQSTLNIGAGNTVTVATNGGDSGVSVVTNLNINATGKIDLTNNDLIVDNGNLTTLTAQLASGLDILGSYGSGPGINGITSSSFANDPNFNTVLGVASNADLGYATFSGQTVDANDVLIKYTYFGDADLNGVVDTATDFDLYITGLTSGGSLGGWLFGDFDYNGSVDSATDFDLYITGLSSQGGPLLTDGGGSNLVQAVPEPSTLVMGSLAMAGLAAWRLRKRRLASVAST